MALLLRRAWRVKRAIGLPDAATFLFAGLQGKAMKRVIFLAAMVAAGGCTSVKVKPARSIEPGTQVCIVNNPKVIVDGFVEVVRAGFSRHDLPTRLVNEREAAACEVTLTYTALRSWDFSPYLSHAELRLWKNGLQIGSAEYHLRGKGGLSLAKWQGVESKMAPVVDRLLEGVR